MALVADLLHAAHELLYDVTQARVKLLVWALLWLPVLIAPLTAWAVAALLAPRGGGSAWRRGAGAMIAAPPIAFGLALVLRFAVFAAGGGGGGPAPWLERLSGLPAWNLAVVVVVVGLGYAASFPLVGLLAGLWNRMRRRTRAQRVPMAAVTATVSLLAVPLVVIGLLWIYGDSFGDQPHVLLDLTALLPAALVCLTLWTAATWEPLERRERRREDAPPARPPPLDVAALWRSIGALAPDARPLVGAHGARGGPTPAGPAQAAWRHAGGPGAAPGALDALFETWREPDQGWLVPDLPDPSERLFLAAALLLAIREHGIPCLVVTEGPAALRDDLERAMQASGAWSCGPLVAGERELRSAFAGGRLPAAAFLDVAELSAEGIRALAGRGRDAGALWCRGVGLVVLSRVDRGTPLEVTHRTFVLQRLGLALRAREARWSVLATGFGGGRSRALVHKAFPGLGVREVPLEPRTSADVRVWLGQADFRDAGGDPWVKRAAEPVAGAGFPVTVGDPLGAFGRGGIDIWGADLRLVRDVALDGLASVSELDEAWLVASVRALGNRVPLDDGGTHHALWGLADNPVTRFLTRDQNLLGLHQSGELHPPRPLLGTGNQLVARTHLEAALRECHQDLLSLEDVFGRPLLDQVLGADPGDGGHAVRRRPSVRQPTRVPLAELRSDTAAATLRETVTSKVMRVRHADSGEVLAEVDRVCAPTRYYPRRVFAIGEHRYRVPFQALDDKRGQILVQPVPHDRPLTRPLLDVQVSQPTLTVAPQRFEEGSLAFHLATFEARVAESVRGFRTEDNTGSYDPVTARYRTVVRGIFFDEPMDDAAAHHLARQIDAVLVAHLFAHEEDIEVFPVAADFHPGLPAGVLVVDRYIRGMGAAEALDDLAVRDVLVWARTILYECSCEAGCSRCTPAEVLDRQPNRPGVLRVLGVR